MRIFYTSFNEYRKLDENIKSNFLFLSTAFTTPSYWNGKSFKPFVPSDELFFDACKDFSTSNFEERYDEQIKRFDRIKVLNKLKEISNGKDVVFLVWEAEGKPSERDTFIPWITNTSIKDIKAFSLSEHLKNLNDTSFFNI